MRRREFIAGLMLAPTMRGAVAQQPSKLKRIAMVHPTEKVSNMTISGYRDFRVFLQELGRLGYVEGQNLVVERYSGEGRTEGYADLARDIVSTHPDLIFSMTGRIALGLKKATTTIPIVAINSDPIALGLVPSLARPGGNITGVSVDAGIEVYGKRLGLLVEVTPKLSNARFLVTQTAWEASTGAAAREAARQAGVSLAAAVLDSIVNEAAYQRVFNLMEQERVDALLVSDNPEHLTFRQLLVELAAKSRIPALYPFREHVDLGGLMSYSPDLSVIFRRLAGQTAEILKGVSPGEIPFHQPTKFELIINLKTAKWLGLNIPPALLATADEVIE